MRILILGGTVFLGRAFVEAASARGHELTLFYRGRSGAELFPELRHVHGDRDGDLARLGEGPWDAVVDTCGYLPRLARASAEHLAPRAARYLFVSTISVYGDTSMPDQRENAPLARLDDPEVEEITGETYGPLKALCEEAVQEAFPGRALIVRPGLIVGPWDPSDRFSYWPWRMGQGGDVLAPGRPERLVQFIDVRDLAAWMLTMLEGGRIGTYNATGHPLPMGELLEACGEATGRRARPVWAGEDFLLEREVGPWMEMPLWMPESDPSFHGFFRFDSSAAIGAGLAFRPLAETVADTWRWLQTRPSDHEWRAGLAPEREQELLDLWRS